MQLAVSKWSWSGITPPPCVRTECPECLGRLSSKVNSDRAMLNSPREVISSAGSRPLVIGGADETPRTIYISELFTSS